MKNILICGLGGVGCTLAVRIVQNKDYNLKVLVDKERYEEYTKVATTFNGEPYYFEYIKPDDTSFKADLIIIATKNDGLKSAIQDIKNFVGKKTIFMSLLNGISSEEEIAKSYGKKNIITSFYIGHSCIRQGRDIKLAGSYKLVIGCENKQNLNAVKSLFDNAFINYETPENILEEYWKKFVINVGVNQMCAATGLTLKEIKKKPKLIEEMKGLMKEAALIAETKGINCEKIYTEAENFLLCELEDAYPSMLQDVLAKRKTEIDLFSGTVIKLGKQYNIATPFNSEIYSKIQ